MRPRLLHHLPPGAAGEAGFAADGRKSCGTGATGSPCGLKACSVNRLCKALKAALNLAAAHDDRITNAKAWTIGLAALPRPTTPKPIWFPAMNSAAMSSARAYAISAGFGLYVEVHAVTGARTGQIAVLDVGDLDAGSEPKLMMPSSLKGWNRRTRTRKPVPIAPVWRSD